MLEKQYPVREIRYQDLENEPFDSTVPTVYAIVRDGVRFEFLVRRRKHCRQAVVFGTGTLSVPSEKWPFFSRHTWMDDLPYNCIYYFDPTLYLGGVMLAWGYGTNRRWYLREIGGLLRTILGKLGVEPKDALMMGSSGGGFTSLMLATMLRSRALAINPQTDFRRYYAEDKVRDLRQTVLKSGEDWIPERSSVAKLIRRERYCPYMHIVQNLFVVQDVATQLTTLQKELCGGAADVRCGTGKFKIEFYYDRGGHGAMPPKATCLEFIRQDLCAQYADEEPTPEPDRSPVPAEEETAPEEAVLECAAAYELRGRDLTVRLTPVDGAGAGREYAFYLYRGMKVVDKSDYSASPEKTWRELPSGRYHAKYFVRTGKQMKQSFSMNEVVIE